MITDKGVAVPDDMASTLQADEQALSAFQALRPDDQRVYVDWITRASTQDRGRRLDELAAHVRSYQRREAEEHGTPHPLQNA